MAQTAAAAAVTGCKLEEEAAAAAEERPPENQTSFQWRETNRVEYINADAYPERVTDAVAVNRELINCQSSQSVDSKLRE